MVTPHYRIGLVYVPSRTFHERVNAALAADIATDKRFSIKHFTVASAVDTLLVNATCQAAAESDVDLLICSGIGCTQALIQLLRRRGIAKPVVFVGVNDPVGIGIVASLDAPGGLATGAFNTSIKCKTDPAELLLALKPHARRILLPYAVVSDSNEPQAHLIKEWCAHRNVAVTLLPIDTIPDTISRVSVALPGHDAMLYLEADALANYGAGLGKLAGQHHVTLLAGSFDGEQDAAVAYVADLSSLAYTAFSLAKRILINGEKPGAIPIKASCAGKLIVNQRLCAEQDLPLLNEAKVAEMLRVHPHLQELAPCICIN